MKMYISAVINRVNETPCANSDSIIDNDINVEIGKLNINTETNYTRLKTTVTVTVSELRSKINTARQICCRTY